MSNASPSEEKKKAVLGVGAAAVAVAVILMTSKTWAYAMTGSSAVLSSLLDSGIDVLMSALTWLSLRYSLMPPDEDHRYGHGKIEGVSALVQATLMFSGGAVLAYDSVPHLFAPQPMPATELGIGVMVLSIVLSLVLVRIQGQAVADHHSLAIEADKGHYSNDAVMNLSTIAVLVLAPWTGWTWLDPLFAIGVAVLMLRLSWTIGRKAFDMLLDREVEDDLKARMRDLILTDPAIVSLHDLRVTRHGMRLMVTYDIEMDGAIPLTRAHDIAVASEDRVLAEFPQAEVMTHMDPEGSDHSRRHHIMDRHEGAKAAQDVHAAQAS